MNVKKLFRPIAGFLLDAAEDVLKAKVAKVINESLLPGEGSGSDGIETVVKGIVARELRKKIVPGVFKDDREDRD
jgi:hypothetical protein